MAMFTKISASVIALCITSALCKPLGFGAVKRALRKAEQFGGPPPMGGPPVDPEVIDSLTQTVLGAIGTCDIDTSFMDAATKLSTGDPSEMESYYEIFKNTCSSSQETTFLTALNNFHTCSGIDLLDYMEYLPSAIVGSLTECIGTLDPDLLTGNPEDLERLEISRECRNSFLGKNVFGDANRIFMMHPERTVQCFKSLSVTTPKCTYQTWPIPLVGNALRQIACLMGEMSPVIETAALSELRKLDQCLPESMQSTTCEIVRQGCRERGSMLTGVAVVIDSLEGMPLNDAYTAVAKKNGLEHAVARYDGFNKACSDHPWDGWKDETSVPPPGQSGSSTGTSSTSRESVSTATVSAAVVQPKQTNAAAVFFGGLITGMALVSLVAFYVIRKQKAKGRYDNIELSEGHMDLALT